MTPKPRFLDGTRFANSRQLMRSRAALLVLPLLSIAPAASAQTISINTVFRQGSPRAGEQLGGSSLSSMSPIGLRDCPCETWTFNGSVSGIVGGANPLLQFWVGTSATACATSTNRVGSGTTVPSCFPIPGEIVPSQNVTPNFSVTVPSVLLINPTSRTCTPLPTLNTSGSVWFTVLGVGPVEMPPQATQQVDFNLQPPLEPTVVTGNAQENSAQVSWTIGTSTGTTTTTTFDDSGAIITSDGGSTSTLSPSLAGFYVLCFPGPPANFDAGISDVCPNGPVNVGDASIDAFDTGLVDTGTDVANGVTDATDVTGADVNATDATGTDVTMSDAGAVCPSVPSFDPNDDLQFNQYRCSTLLSRTTSTFVVQGLTNNVPYRFAVVSQDTAGNRSIVVATGGCVTPQLVTDIWEHYHGTGGLAQPGFCATRPGPVGLRGIVPIAFAAIGLVAWRRRRNRRKDGAPRGDA